MDAKVVELRGSWDSWQDGIKMKLINKNSGLHEASVKL